MPDIFDEVEEDLRRERAKKIWDSYAPVIVGVALAIVFAVGGWRIYQHVQAQRAAADGDRYYGAMQLATQGQHEDAAAAFVKLAQDGTSGYRTLGRLRAAAETALRDPGAAVAAYDVFAADSSEPAGLRDIARIRAGYLLVDAGTYADAEKRVGSLADPADPMRNSAREVLGLSAWRSGDTANARKWLEAVTADAGTPDGFRQRAEVVLDLIASGEAPPAPSVPAPAEADAASPAAAVDPEPAPVVAPPEPAAAFSDMAPPPVPSLSVAPSEMPAIMSAPAAAPSESHSLDAVPAPAPADMQAAPPAAGATAR